MKNKDNSLRGNFYKPPLFIPFIGEKKLVILLILVGALVWISLYSTNVGAIENSENVTDYEEATLCLNESIISMQELEEANFSILRINDTLKELKNIYNAQKVLIKTKKDDFSLVFTYCEEIANLKILAFQSRDELIALKQFYNEFLEQTMNTSSADILLLEIENEIQTERYEKVKPLVDEAYEEIVDIKAEHTALNLFYRSTTQGIKDFFISNWITLIIILGVLILLYIFYNKAIRRIIIKRKISHLEIKRNTLKELIQKTQRDYFEKGTLAEGDYEIKTKNFAEMIREVNRDIPLLKAELYKINEKGKNKLDVIEEKIKKQDIQKEKKKIIRETEKKFKIDKNEEKELLLKEIEKQKEKKKKGKIKQQKGKVRNKAKKKKSKKPK